MESMVNSMLDFYKGKRVFVTGHTGFKGAWLCRILANAGAHVTGYALAPATNPALYSLTGTDDIVTSIIGDIRNFEALCAAYEKADPEIVFHLAAQPIVRDSYKDPRYTYETNVMGTVNVLECARFSKHTKSLLNVTTDKVYKNMEWNWGYRETDMLDGYDPYSNSKSCSELATHSYINSFFRDGDVAVSTARAGNVIGGGDFAGDRIIPDSVRAACGGTTIAVRNPHSTRPYQHVLEPLFAYLMIAERQYKNPALSGSYNVGPEDCDCVCTGDLVDIFCTAWGDGLRWKATEESGPHEANFLKLDCSLIHSVFGWKPKWHIQQAVEKVVEWTRTWQNGANICAEMDREIAAYIAK